MANRSYIYLKKDEEAGILAEGIYQIPLFWHCLWTLKELEPAFVAWRKAFSIDEDDDEAFEEFLKTMKLMYWLL